MPILEVQKNISKMIHVYFFYFFMTFSIGLVSLGIAVTTYFKTKNTLLRYYLYFHAAFTLLVVLNTFLTYIRINMTQIHPYLLGALDYVEAFIAQYILMFTISVFVHYFFSVPHPKIRNIIVAGISIGTSFGEHASELLIQNGAIEQIFEYIEDSVFLFVLLYAFFTGIYYYRTLHDQERKRLAAAFLILFGIFLPGGINDTFLTGLSPLRFYPLLYCGFSIMFTYHFLKDSFKQQQVVIPNTSDEETHKKLFEEYRISPREQEIVLLILQGYSNQKIGETLFISLSTVKTHIRNIYLKTGVKTRYELMTFFRT